jgi:hypothetical protein
VAEGAAVETTLLTEVIVVEAVVLVVVEVEVVDVVQDPAIREIIMK